MSEELKLEACPCCGGQISVHGQQTLNLWKLCRAHCASCGLTTANYATPEEAAAAMNRRAPSAPAPDVEHLTKERDIAHRALAEAARRFAAGDMEGVRLLLCDRNARENAAAIAPAPEFAALVGKLRQIVSMSHGVAGYHLNGDVAPWNELGIEDELAAAERALKGGGDNG